MKQKSIIFFILLGTMLSGCKKEDSSSLTSSLEISYYISHSSDLSIDMLELNVVEDRIWGEHCSTISSSDFDFNDQSDFYFTELATSNCCSAEIEFCFSEAVNSVVSGSFSISLDPGVRWEISLYPFRPPFFYVCYENHIYPVVEEYRDNYGDSLYVKWSKVTF